MKWGYPAYNGKTILLELRKVWSTFSLSLFQGSLISGAVVAVSVQSVGKIDMFKNHQIRNFYMMLYKYAIKKSYLMLYTFAQDYN